MNLFVLHSAFKLYIFIYHFAPYFVEKREKLAHKFIQMFAIKIRILCYSKTYCFCVVVLVFWDVLNGFKGTRSNTLLNDTLPLIFKDFKAVSFTSFDTRSFMYKRFFNVSFKIDRNRSKLSLINIYFLSDATIAKRTSKIVRRKTL